jgi:hypothetical protein
MHIQSASAPANTTPSSTSLSPTATVARLCVLDLDGTTKETRTASSNETGCNAENGVRSVENGSKTAHNRPF